MRGNIEIYQSLGDQDKLVFSESNMAVDGMREAIANVMTFMPNPSSLYEPFGASGARSVSSYQVQAMTLGCAKDYYNQRDTRFWYSAMETSATTYCLQKPKTNDDFEMIDSWSSIGPNQWQYLSRQNANILTSDWETLYKFPDTDFNSVSTRQDDVEGKLTSVTRYEVKRGQQRVTLRQRAPIRLGANYFLYSKGRALNATFDFRICRGRQGEIFEYYDFNQNIFVSKTTPNTQTTHTVQLGTAYEVDEYRFKVHGHTTDNPLQPNTQYYVEYIFPSKNYVDENFSPWQQPYQDPYVDIVDLALCDGSRQILSNPNFLEHQSVLVNSDFTSLRNLREDEVVNPDSANEAGFRNANYWSFINPVIDASDPGQNDVSKQFASVRPGASFNLANTVFSDMTNGVVLYTSSLDNSTSSCAGVSQTFTLNDKFRNVYAFQNPLDTSPFNLNQPPGIGQSDNNATLMLSFKTMVSGATATPGNLGSLDIGLVRDADGFSYAFSADATTNKQGNFSPTGGNKRISYDATGTWLEVSVPIMLDADAARQSYSLNIKGTGRTSPGTGGFAYYAIKDLCLGPIEGWRTYNYEYSSLGQWSLSSNGNGNVASGNTYSALCFSGPRIQSLGTYQQNEYSNALSSNTVRVNQLTHNFVGLEPTKTYRLAVKGTYKTNIPHFDFTLKTKGRARDARGNMNILSNYASDPGLVNYAPFSGVSVPVGNLNPYSNNGKAFRRTFASFVNPVQNQRTSPTDWGILLNASGQDGHSVAEEHCRGNAGDYFLSMDVINRNQHGSYFVLSSMRAFGENTCFFNWESGEWDLFATPADRPYWGGSTSGLYFLELPTGKTTSFQSFKYPNKIPFGTPLESRYFDNTANNSGGRGDFNVTPVFFGPSVSSTDEQTLVKNIELRGPGVNPNVDIWKELYYQWNNSGDWAWQRINRPAIKIASLNSDAIDTNYHNFIASPSSVITNMCFSGLDRDTVYQLNIKDVSGGEYAIHDIALIDTAYVANTGADPSVRDPNIFTSEAYAPQRYYEYPKGTVIKSFSALSPNGIQDPSSGIFPYHYPQPPVFAINESPYIQVKGLRNAEATMQNISPWYIRSFTLDDYDLEGGDEFAFGWEAAAIQLASTMTAYVAVEARNEGVAYNYNWNTSEWEQGSTRREKSFNIKEIGILDGGGDALDIETYADIKQWTNIVTPGMKAPTFGPNTKIIASMRFDAAHTTSNSTPAAKNFKVYRTVTARRQDNYVTAGDRPPAEYRVSGDTFLFPEFPNPQDISLQSKGASGSSSELGHFLNRINFFDFSAGYQSTYSSIQPFNNPANPSITGEKTMEEAVMMGSYLPSGQPGNAGSRRGLWMEPGTFGLSGGLPQKLLSGVLNTMAVVNSDGYIYRHPNTPTNANDASAGFVVSSFYLSSTDFDGWTFKPKTVRYVLKVHKDDWIFLDYYMGGLGALGLHAIDYKKSYDKLGMDWQVSSLTAAGSEYSQGKQLNLYNVVDPSRNPVFTLTNKKVVFPPGLHIDYDNTEWLTIIWDINFINGT